MNKLAVYSACIGERSALPERTALDTETDYIAFLNPDREMNTWDVFPGGLVSTPGRQQPDWPRLTARAWKCCPDIVLPDHEYTLWIDGSMQLIKSPREDLEDLLGDNDLVGYTHPRRQCVYEEIATCMGDKKEVFQPRDHPYVLQTVEEKYRAEGMPEDFGLIENGFLLRRASPAMRDFGEMWCQEVVDTTLEDQLVMMYCLWKSPHIKWKALEGDATNNPYINWVGHVGNR